MSSLRNVILACVLSLALAACDSAEERAEAYLESARELIAGGDLDRAAIELRNVFELAPNHVVARETMARLMLDQDNRNGAYGQYLRLVEQVPDHVEGRTVLAEIAFEARNWEEFSRHGRRVVELAPEAPRSRMIDLALRYREAVESGDDPARDAMRTQAEEMAQTMPESGLLQQILFDAYVRDAAYDKALGQLDAMLERQPDNRALYAQRLALLAQTRDFAALEAQLRDMVARFPDDNEPKAQLVQFLMSRDETDKAEAFLRDISDPAAEDPAHFIDLVRFLSQVRGVDAARAELERAIDVSPNPDRFRVILAAMDFETGQRDKAITDLQAILDRSEPSGQTNDIKVTLARMLAGTGNEVGARRLVDEVLEANSSHVEALKMRAAWMVRSDDTDGAIASLRSALDAAPGDVQAINLMAEAYTRAGNHELAQDFLALAVDASGNAPGPTLRYARVLAQDERYVAAEEVLFPALRRDPGNADLLVLLGEIYLASEDYSRADQVIRQLRAIGTERTETVADALQARVLGSREGVEQGLAFLEELAGRDDASLNTQIALLRARLSSGQTEAAITQARELVAENPDNATLRFILASAQAADGDLEGAEEVFRALVAEDPARERVWQQLYLALRAQGKAEAAQQALRDGLAAAPNSRDLLWTQAGELEAAGEIDQAIGIYEDLYARNSGDVVIANNLASLLSTHRTDDESLERAWTVARRLRDSEIPALQDTYGWIAFRRGDVDVALTYLEDAAAGLPGDPIVQYHLGQVYAALERPEDALEQYRKALDIAGEDDTRPQMETARSEIDRLQQQQSDQ